MANIDLRKKVRIHEALSETLSAMPLKELDFETLFFLLAKLSKSHKDETVYNLNIREFQELTGGEHNLYQYVDSFKRLRSYTFEIETDKSILVDGILQSAELMKGLGTVQVQLSSKMKPYLLSLTENYTEHQLYSIIKLKSKHSKRFYLYFCNHRPRSGVLRTVLEYQTIEEFKERLGYIDKETGRKLYEKTGHFIDRVLKVARDEINTCSNLRIAYKLKKWGREYNWIEWTIENKANEELIKLESFNQIGLGEGDFAQKIDEMAFIERLKEEYGLSDHQADKVAKMLDRTMLLNSLKKVDVAKENKKIKTSLGGFTRKVLLTDFGTDLKI